MLKVIIADDEKLICRLVQALADWELLGMEVVAGHRLVVLEDMGNFISDQELKKIHGILRHYAAQGMSFLYIASHFEEVRQICHRTALMMNGVIIKCFHQWERVPATFLLDCVEEFERKVKGQLEKKPEQPGQPEAVFQAADLCLDGEERLNFSVAPGECLVLQDLDNGIFPGLIEVLSGKQRPKGGAFTWTGRCLAAGEIGGLLWFRSWPPRRCCFPM